MWTSCIHVLLNRSMHVQVWFNFNWCFLWNIQLPLNASAYTRVCGYVHLVFMQVYICIRRCEPAWQCVPVVCVCVCLCTSACGRVYIRACVRGHVHKDEWTSMTVCSCSLCVCVYLCIGACVEIREASKKKISLSRKWFVGRRNGGAKSKETRYSTVTVWFYWMIQLTKSPTFYK